MYYVQFYQRNMTIKFGQDGQIDIDVKYVTTHYRKTYSNRMEARKAAAAYANELWDRSHIFREWMPFGEKTEDYRAIETTRAFYDNITGLYYTYVLETNKEEA